MTTTQTPPRTRTRRIPVWIKALLVGSLAVNLAVVGVVAGAAWRLHGHDDDGPRVSPPLGIVLFRALEPEDRRSLRADLGDRARPHRVSRRAILIEIPDALRADPPDLARLEEIIETEVARHSDWLIVSNQSWLAHVAAMDAAARAAYADRIEAAMRQKSRDRPRNPEDAHRWKHKSLGE